MGDTLLRGSYQKLNPKALAIGFGILLAICVFILGLMPVFFNGWGKTMVLEISSVYIGYKPGVLGALIGSIWAFVDGLIGGYLIGWLYNKFLKL